MCVNLSHQKSGWLQKLIQIKSPSGSGSGICCSGIKRSLEFLDYYFCLIFFLTVNYRSESLERNLKKPAEFVFWRASFVAHDSKLSCMKLYPKISIDKGVLRPTVIFSHSLLMPFSAVLYREMTEGFWNSSEWINSDYNYLTSVFRQPICLACSPHSTDFVDRSISPGTFLAMKATNILLFSYQHEIHSTKFRRPPFAFPVDLRLSKHLFGKPLRAKCKFLRRRRTALHRDSCIGHVFFHHGRHSKSPLWQAVYTQRLGFFQTRSQLICQRRDEKGYFQSYRGF